jgi:sucrose-6-phosphate hydrolase SacC (GH32 family)
MLLFCSHLQGTQYYLGRYEDDRLHPERYARMSWPGGHLGGGITLLDGNGRRIFFDWIRETRTSEAERASGWSGVMTVPRVLSLGKDNSLTIEPVPELEMLRQNHRHHENIHMTTNSELPLDDVRGDCLELAVEVDVVDGVEFGVKVRCSPGAEEQTAIVCNPGAKTLSVDIGKSTLDKSIRYIYYRNESATKRVPESKRVVTAQEAPFELSPGESLKLRIFLDRSVLEVFANGRQCVTQRIYPTRSDSLGVTLFSRGGSVDVKSLDTWDMGQTNE